MVKQTVYKMKQENEKPTGLPENAFRPLNEGEEYKPLMSPDKKYPEVNFWSVSWGILMAVLFSAAFFWRALFFFYFYHL